MSEWTVYDDRKSTGRIEIVKMGRTVARMYYADAEALADALKAAAAPEMLEALKGALAPLMAYNGYGWPDRDGKIRAIEALIAKAEGRQP